VDEDAIRFGAHASGIGLPPIPDKDAPIAANGWEFQRPELAVSGQFGQWHPYFGSSHNGGINACMADGAVRFIAFTVDAEAFRRASLTDSKLPSTLDD
jgi:prepilin-type processing-associated H-X9-DG protein